MARSRDIQQYPEEYLDIVREVGGEGKIKCVPFDRPAEAASLRGHFYSFIGALRKFAEKWEPIAKERKASPGTLDLLDIYMQSKKVQVTIETVDEKPCCVFQHRENSWQAQALRRAFEIKPGNEGDKKTPEASRDLGEDRELTVEEAMELIRNTKPGRK